MKRIIATGAVAALAMVGFAGTASAEPMGKGQGNGLLIQQTFESTYGEIRNMFEGEPLGGVHGTEPITFKGVGAAKFWAAHAG